MARIFITGSSDGLGQMAAVLLIKQGHKVVLHARNAERALQTKERVPGADTVLIADLSSMEATKDLAAQANDNGYFDAIIHNAGLYLIGKESLSADGLPLLFAVNTLAPYILTCLIRKPERLIYLSSGMHRQGDPDLKDLSLDKMTSLKSVTYSDTKLNDLILSMAVARRWPDIFANAVDPGWVPTKMGGAGASDNLEKGFETQAWLAVSNDADAKVSGHYFYHQKQRSHLPAGADIYTQEKLLAFCEQVSGVAFP